MRTFYTLATIGLLSFTASMARAQLPGLADRTLDGAARADVNADDRASEAVNIERGRLSGSSDPAAHISTNPNAANLDASAREAANLPRANADGNVGIAGNTGANAFNLGRLGAHRIVKGQGAIQDATVNLSAFRHFAERCRVDRGRHL